MYRSERRDIEQGREVESVSALWKSRSHSMVDVEMEVKNGG